MKKGLSLFVTSTIIVSSIGIPANISYADSNKVSRISGKDRYETCAEISKKSFEKSDIAVITSGENYPDALSSGAFATKYKAPLLLVRKNQIPHSISNELKRLGVKEIKLIGGDSSISKSLFNLLAKNYKIERISGANRFETSLKTARSINMIKGKSDGNIFVNGNNFSDALVATSLATKLNKNIILTDGKSLPPMYENILGKPEIKNNLIIGGKESINIPNIKAEQIGGKNRFDTSLKIAKKYFTDIKKTILASGDIYIDSLSASNLAGKENIPILLNDGNQLRKDVKEYIENNKVSNVFLVGGTTTLPESITKSVLQIINNKSDTPKSKPDPIPDQNDNINPGKNKYKNGTWKGIGEGFHSNNPSRKMEVEITIENDKLKNLKLLKFGDDNGYKNNYQVFENRFFPKIKEDINIVPKIINSIINSLAGKPAEYPDVATGATYSNKGVMLAVQDALKQAEIANSGEHTNIKDLIFSKKPKVASVYFNEALSLDEFEITIRHWNPNENKDIVVGINELSKYGIEVNIANGTIINRKNIKMDDSGRFDIVFEHKKSKKEVSANLQAFKKIVYKRELKQIEVEFNNGHKETINGRTDAFSYKLKVDKDNYTSGIKSVKLMDENNENIPIKKSNYVNGTCYIDLENKRVEKEFTIEKEFRFDGYQVRLEKNYTENNNVNPKPVDEDEPNVPEKVVFKDGDYTGKSKGYRALKQNGKENEFKVTIKNGKISSIDVTKYNDDKGPFEETFYKNVDALFKNIINNFADGNMQKYEDYILNLNNQLNDNIEAEENGKPNDKKAIQDVTSGATYSTKSAIEAVIDIISEIEIIN